MELLNGPYLFDSMYADDAEAAKLAYLPGVSVLLETYPSPYSVLSVSVYLEHAFSLRQLALDLIDG